ncbi:MAG: helix-turn-helix domain-containing protein, partial [Lachnospiraceae bacterium]
MNQNPEIPIELLHYLKVQQDTSLEYSFYAFLYVTYGSIRISLGNEPHLYQRNDLLLLSPGRKALLQAQEDCELMILGLSSSFLEDHLNMPLFSTCDSTLHPEQDYLPLKKQLFLTADLYAKNDSGISYTLLGSCYLILGELQRLFGDAVAPKSQENKYSSRVRAIADYIDQNYMEPLTLPDLAGKFYLTPQYLSAFFRENFHTTFKNYLNDQRLFYSLRDLRSTNLPISEVALQNGFSSFSAYRKNFVRRYGMTPSEFRTSHQQQEKAPHTAPIPTERPDHAEASESIRESIELCVTQKTRHIERKDLIINIGAVQNLQSQQFRKELVLFCQHLSFRYVRVMGMVASSFLPAMLPDYALNFQSLDSCLSFFHASHLLPFVELTRHQFNFMFQQAEPSRINFIQRSERWFRLLESFLAHITSLWPETWLQQWKFELWMTPS